MDRDQPTAAGLAIPLACLLALAAFTPVGAQGVSSPPADDRPSTEQDGEQTDGDQSAAVDEKAEVKPKISLDLSSPRATMQTFLVAIQDAAGDHPQRIDDAVRCLDTSELPDSDGDEQARALARRLAAIIDRQGVKLDDIPDAKGIEEQGISTYVFGVVETEQDQEATPEIRLTRDPETMEWRFAAAALAAIPELEAKLKKEPPAEEVVDAKIPAARRSPRATMATFISAMTAEPKDLAVAVDCLDPTGQDIQAWSVRGKDLAHKLKNVIDKIKLVVFTDIPPPAPDAAPYVWHTSETGNIVIGRMAEGEFAGEWRFTSNTLKTLDALYLLLEDKPLISELREAGVEEELPFDLWLQRQMPEWLRHEYVYLQGWQWAALLALVVVSWLIRITVTGVVKLFVRRWFERRGIEVDQRIRHRALKWSGVVAAALFSLFAIQSLQLPVVLLAYLLPGLKLVVALTLVWFGYRVVDVLGSYIARSEEVRLTQFDDLLVPLLRTVLRLGVAIVVVLFAIEWLGYNATTVLGALGIGGFALAFAAKDTLGNFFGSLTVLLDRPFGIGDWVVIGDVEGTVERVGFRSTRIRTFYNSMITIPNAQMATLHVDNFGARRFRRAKCMLSLTYDTPPEKIDAFCEGIRELIRLHPHTRKDYYHVYFNKFASSSLDVLLYMFFEVPDWSTELRERHRLFVDILRLADRLGVQFAFPTQTVWLERARAAADRPTITPGKDDPDAVGLDHAATVFEEAYGADPAARGQVVIDTFPRSKRRDGPGRKRAGDDADRAST